MDYTLFASESKRSVSFMLLILGMITIKTALWRRKTQVQQKKEDSIDTRDEVVDTSLCASRRPYKRQMSSLGRFSLQSQTTENPSVMTFFLLLKHKEGQDIQLEELNDLLQRGMLDRYERFNARICLLKNGTTFEIIDRNMNEFSFQVAHPNGNCEELKERVEFMLLSPLNAEEKLWEVLLSSGDIGSCGAVPFSSCSDSMFKRETLILFRAHHAICDGVSMSSVLGDLTDESSKLRLYALDEKEKFVDVMAMNETTWFRNFVLYYFVGGIWALVLQFWRMMFSINPFDDIIKRSSSIPRHRSISWRHLGTIDEIKALTKAISQRITLNDLAVSLVTAAIRMQLEVHNETTVKLVFPKTVNVVIPAHLDRGIIHPGNEIGNKIGAFVTSIPIDNTRNNKSLRVMTVSRQLKEGKQTPAPKIARLIAKFLSDCTPQIFAKVAMRKANAQSVAVISNIRGFPFPVHWLGRRVQMLCAFLPIPPGIPIGIMIVSYAGNVSFSVNADSRAVPDAEQFATWMTEEFNLLKRENGV